ncbi:hypothetical protein GCM10010052_18710 [Paenarthrobacter histidinolovorans]|nr:hypothetical protein GCM10010052_18710 [Paenarthrobacter histidinolovorans]
MGTFLGAMVLMRSEERLVIQVVSAPPEVGVHTSLGPEFGRKEGKVATSSELVVGALVNDVLSMVS